jgi:hypothetical protein
MKTLNLAVRFALELGMLGALAWWGFSLDRGLAVRIAAGVGAPLAVAVAWGVWIGPKASLRLTDPLLLLAELAAFGLGGLALWAASGRPWLAAVFFAAATLTSALVRVWGQ